MNGTIEITAVGICRNMCCYCPQPLLAKRYKEDKLMSLETFKTCIDKVPKHLTIDFAGFAEPFLNPLLPDMAVHAFESGYSLRLYTTLVGLTLDGLERIKNVRFKSVVLHLPDSDNIMKANVNDEYIEVAKKFSEHFYVENTHVYGELHDRLQDVFPDCVRLTLTNRHLHTRAGNLQNDRVRLEREKYVSGRIRCGVIVREGGSRINHNILMPNGDVVLCCMDYGLDHKLGNLLHDSYEDLFQSEEYKRVERALDNEDEYILCRTCKEAYPA